MHVLRIEHDVADYDAWKGMFDSDPLGRAQSGVTGHQVLRVPGDPERVLIDLQFADAGSAETFQARLRELWGRVDVMQSPTSQIGEVVETSEY